MLKNNNLLSDSELFEQLNDLASEKISGGASLEGMLEEFDSIKLLDGNLQEKINAKIKELFPQGLGSASALSCATTTDGKLKCDVGTDGQKKNFEIPL